MHDAGGRGKDITPRGSHEAKFRDSLRANRSHSGIDPGGLVDSNTPLASTPSPPYWAVIFTSERGDTDAEAYGRMAEAMTALARRQPGFLGVESVRDAAGVGITVSYWSSEEAIRAWKGVAQHRTAQQLGRERWYRDYVLRVARVERTYSMATSRRQGLE